ADTPGNYEVRYVMGKSKRILARASVSVKAAQASLSLSGDAMVDAPIEVSWTGPDNDKDYITVVESGAPQGKYLGYTYTKQGSPLTVRGPKTPGQYEIRYVMGQSKNILTSLPVTVTPLSAHLEAPAKAAPGASIEVSWKGPNNPQDFIAIAKKDAPFNSYQSRALSAAGSPSSLFAPTAPGEYEIRYVLSKSKQVLASVPISVAAAPEQ
ncbi:MAG: VWA domain-containing protein, partial [Acidobacteriota bacterium]